MPDDELLDLAARGQLRKNLDAQVKRMVADPKAEGFIESFAGQWLQARDVEGIAINDRVVLNRDDSLDLGPRRLAALEQAAGAQAKPVTLEKESDRPEIELDGGIRHAMRHETEMCFGYVLREDRSVLEFLDSDYTFLNQNLARYYGLTNVTGNEMRRVSLPPDSPRGGVLTEGTVLVVTSNPTRTSPVKRGVFILDNILGTPTPPPPPNIPPLEASDHRVQGREPTLREMLEAHRNQPLCASCHSRMDPLGLALENFNAMGLWRGQDRGQPVDPAGKLLTGETFAGVRELKHVLVSRHRLDFYRCLTEKVLTYALGRGLEYYDVETVDRIVDQLDRENGRFSVLLTGVIESAPFQKSRNLTTTASVESRQPVSPAAPKTKS
jgi:hypothetical protein